MLNSSGESKFSCLFLILEESFQSFSVEYDVSYGLLIYGFYYVAVISFYS